MDGWNERATIIPKPVLHYKLDKGLVMTLVPLLYPTLFDKRDILSMIKDQYPVRSPMILIHIYTKDRI